MKKSEMMMACLLALVLAAGCGDGNGGDEDAETDTIEDTPTDGDDCPPDDATHIYITVTGQVQPLTPGGDVGGIYVAAVNPMDALMPGDPTPIVEGLTEANGSFEFECINVAEVDLGMVIWVDDDPDGTDDLLFPTGTGVKAWDSDEEKVDVPDATPFAVTREILTGLGALITTLDPATNGVAMGLVIDSATRGPIDGAQIQTTAGDPAPVSYPTADLTGLETDDNTSASGMFVFNGAVTLGRFTAEASGHTFGEHTAATKPEFCYFMLMADE